MAVSSIDLPPPPPDAAGWPWVGRTQRLQTRDAEYPIDSWPRISVVTPSYQQADFLEETLRSVLLQGYPDLEYIVVDGGSTDGSVDIIRRYEPWITYWTSEADRGQSDALRKGFERSTGEILAWLNSDDRYRPGALLAAARQFNRHSNAGLVYARSAFCDEAGTLTGRRAGRDFSLEEMIRGKNCVAQPSAFFSRHAYRDAGGIDHTLHYVMDMDLWMRISLTSEIVFIDDVWSDFRVHPHSKTGQGELRFDEEIYSMTKEAFASLPLPDGLASERQRILAALLMRLAYRHYQLGDDRRARRHALQAAFRNSALLADAGQRWIFFRALLGRGTMTCLKRILRVSE